MGWLLAGLALPGAGRAEQVVSGGTLVVEDPCAERVELREDSSLGGAGRLVGVSAEPEGSGPAVSGGDVVRVGGPCRRRAERLRLRVSPGLAVRLSGASEWRVGTLGGTVDATLDGHGDAEFGTLRVLRLRRSGGGDTHVDAVSERLDATLSGAGSVTVDRLDGTAALRVGEAATVTANRVALDGLDVAAGGGSSVTIRKGRVGRLSAALSEGSSLHADVVAASARLIARGGASIDVARVDGVLDRVADEGSTVTVHVASAPQAGDAPAAPHDPDAARGLRSRAGDAYDMRIHPDAPSDAADRDAAGWGARQTRVAPGWLTHALMAFALLGSAAVALRARRRRQRRPESLRAGWSEPRAGTGPRPREAAMPWPGEAGVAALEQRLAAVEARLVRVERYVTSGELELQRQFRDLAHERDGPGRQG